VTIDETIPVTRAPITDANVKAAQMVHELAAAHHAKPGRSRWPGCYTRATTSCPFPVPKRRKYLEENLAAETIRLDPAQMKILDDASAPGKFSGRRYPDSIMATIDR